MTRPVRFLAAAEAQIDEAIVWYENHSQGLGAEFARALRVAQSAVMRDAVRFPVLYVAESGRQVRRVLLRRFSLQRSLSVGSGHRRGAGMHAWPPRSEEPGPIVASALNSGLDLGVAAGVADVGIVDYH